jgi:glycine hydroxymethyltransferase
MILVTEKGLAKDPNLATKIDKAIIPGLQGGPHLNTIAGIGVALHEAASPEFKDYARRVVENAKALASSLIAHGFTLVSGGTDNHLLLVDLRPTGLGRGRYLQDALERVGLYANMNTVPRDPHPLRPSGLRLGTPAATTRGMGPTEMERVAGWIAKVRDHITDVQMPEEKEERKTVMASFADRLTSDTFFTEMCNEVETLCRSFPVPALQE